jgi:PhnB protein
MTSVTPYVMVDSANSFAEFIAAAFEAEIKTKIPLPIDPQRVIHGEARIGNGTLFFADSGPNGERCLRSPGQNEPAHIQLWTSIPDPESALTRAIAGGAHSVMEVTIQEDGSRMGGFIDPWGTLWWVTAEA